MSKKLILAVLGTLYKMPEVEVAEALKKTDGSDDFDEDKAINLIIEKDKERFKSLTDTSTKKFDDGYKKGQKESLDKLEKALKAKYNIEDDLQGEDLVEAIVTATTTQLQGKKLEELTEEDIKKLPAFLKLEADLKNKNELTEESIKKLPAFIKLEKELRKAVDEAKKDGETKLQQVQEEYSQKEVFGKIKDKGVAYFKSKNPILSEDAEKANNQIGFGLLNHLQGYKYQESDGQIIILKPDGNRLEDGHGHPMTLEQLIDDVATKNFDFKKAEDRGAPGNGGARNTQGGGNSDKKYTGKAPSSAKEYADVLLSSSLSIEEKNSFKETYGEQFSG